MKDLNVCPTCSTILQNDPYRSVTLPALKTKTFSTIKSLIGKTYYMIKKLGKQNMFGKIGMFGLNTIIGAVVVVVAYGALWCLFPGLWHLGKYVTIDLLGWNMPMNNHSPAPFVCPWSAGLCIVFFPFVFPWLGRIVKNKLLKK